MRAEAERRFADCAARGISRIGVFDAALLVETGYWREFHRLVVTFCDRETQRRRVVERDGVSYAEAEARLASQWAAERKLMVADYVIDTDVPLDKTRIACAQLYHELLYDWETEVG